MGYVPNAGPPRWWEVALYAAGYAFLAFAVSWLLVAAFLPQLLR